jgi:hypothetical protein
MFNLFSVLLMKPLPAKEIALNDMAEAERQMLQHEAQALYHQKMTEYYATTYHRLSGYVGM